jgi:hypothetical protein
MVPINNIKPLSAETLFDLLKKDFADYINGKLNSNMSIEYAHVYDVINVLFPEVIEGAAFSVIVSDEEITVSDNNKNPEYNSELLQQHLIDFLTIQAG